MNDQHAKDISHALQTPIQELEKPIKVKGFDSISRRVSTRVIWAHYRVDGRVCWNIPFLLLDIGNHDAIIGLRFMEELKWILDTNNREIIWPKSIPPTLSVVRQREISLATARCNRINSTHRGYIEDRFRKGLAIPKTSHQLDAERRDAQMDKLGTLDVDLLELDKKEKLPLGKWRHGKLPPGILPVNTRNLQSAPKIATPIQEEDLVDELIVKKELYPTPLASTYGSSHEKDMKRNYDQMERQISGEVDWTTESVESIAKRRRPTDQYVGPLYRDGQCKIALINGSTLERNFKSSENEIFIATLQEIDNIIEEKQEEVLAKEDSETADLIRHKLPKKWVRHTDIFSKKDSDILPPHRKYDHKIELTGELPSRYSPLYKQSLAELQETKRWILDNLHKGFIEATTAPFASPILFVKKADGSLRLCVDYRQLNKITKKNQYPIPLIDELLSRLSKAKVFTKLDIRSAFNRIRMDPDSEELTALRTSLGSYKCKVLPFGLTNGPATYQRYMNDILMNYLDVFCTAYLDDILIYSEDLASHEIHVNAVLDRLREAGLNADIKKSEFEVTRTKYLGFIVTTEGIEIDPAKTEALRNWKIPTTVREVRGFLGFTGFYRQFVEAYGRIAKPLNNLTKENVPFKFDLQCQKAFNEIRDSILSPNIRKHFQVGYPTMVETDASDGTIGAILSQQHPDGNWYPVAFYSHTMAPAECNYEIHDKELLAIVRAFEEWSPELSSVGPESILVYSDHQALQYFMTKRALTSRQGRWNEILSRFHWVLQYRQGRANGKADALTRRTQEKTLQEEAMRAHRARTMISTENLDSTLKEHQGRLPSTDVDLKSSEEQALQIKAVTLLPIEYSTPDSLPLIQELLEDNKTSFQDLREDLPEGHTIENDLLLFNGRLVVSKDKASQVIDQAHSQVETAHPGINKTYSLLKSRYFWPGMKDDIQQFVRNCPCVRDKARRDKQPGLLKPLPIPNRPWEHITMDFMSLPTSKSGYDAVWVVMDRLSKQSISIACHKTIDSKGLARLYYDNVYRFGHTPATIVSDRGPQFISSFWQDFCAIIGTKVKLSTAFHKETDGQTEIMNQYLLQRLRSFVNHNQDNWDELLPAMDRAQMTLPQDSIGMAPYQLLNGVEPIFDFDWNRSVNTSRSQEPINQQARDYATLLQKGFEDARKSMELAQDKKRRDEDKYRRVVDFEVGDKVWLSAKNLKSSRPSRKLSHKWYGPFEILQQVGSSYKLKLPHSWNIVDTFAPELLRKADDNPLPGQEIGEPPPETIEENYEWEVQEVLDCKRINTKLWYRASWVGFDEDLEWHPVDDFQHSPHKLRDFHTKYPDKPGPPRLLDKWIKEWEEYDSE